MSQNNSLSPSSSPTFPLPSLSPALFCGCGDVLTREREKWRRRSKRELPLLSLLSLSPFRSPPLLLHPSSLLSPVPPQPLSSLLHHHPTPFVSYSWFPLHAASCHCGDVILAPPLIRDMTVERIHALEFWVGSWDGPLGGISVADMRLLCSRTSC